MATDLPLTWKTGVCFSEKGRSVLPTQKLHLGFWEKHLVHEYGSWPGPYKDPYQQQDFLDLRKVSETSLYTLDLLQ